MIRSDLRQGPEGVDGAVGVEHSADGVQGGGLVAKHRQRVCVDERLAEQLRIDLGRAAVRTEAVNESLEGAVVRSQVQALVYERQRPVEVLGGVTVDHWVVVGHVVEQAVPQQVAQLVSPGKGVVPRVEAIRLCRGALLVRCVAVRIGVGHGAVPFAGLVGLVERTVVALCERILVVFAK